MEKSIITYMRREDGSLGLPQEIRICTKLNTLPLNSGGFSQTMTYDRDEFRTCYDEEQCIIGYSQGTYYCTPHRGVVNYFLRRGYRVVEEIFNADEWNKLLEGIPALDLFGNTSKKQWNDFKLMRYLKEQGRI